MIRGVTKKVNTSFIERFIESVKKYPNDVALICDDEFLTYKELYKEVLNCAQIIIDASKDPQHVLVYLPRGKSLIISLIASQYLGVPYIPLTYNIPHERLNQILLSLEDGIIISNENLLNALPFKIDTNKFNIINTQLYNTKINISNNILNPEKRKNETYFIFTSGTTGQPKAVMVNKSGCSNLLDFFTHLLNSNSLTKVLSITSPSFDIFFLEYTLPLANGGTLILLNDTQAASAQTIAEFLMQYNPTIYQSTPSLLKCVLPYLPSSYKFDQLLVGGETLGKNISSMLQKKSNRIYNVYGPTETTVWSTFQILESPDENRIGFPIQNTQIKIVDEDGMEVKTNQHGKIFIGGEGVSNGYFNNVSLTVSKFMINKVDKIKWYDTGDTGYIDEENVLNFVARDNDFIKVNGYRIDLLEISDAIESLSFIVEAAVICERDEYDIDQIKAFVKLSSDCNTSDVENIIKIHLSKKLFNYMLPSSIVVVEEFTRNINGKLDTKALKTTNIEKKNNQLVTNITQIKILNILANYIDTKNLNSEDSFFDAGLTSMRAISLHLDLIKIWPNLELFHLFEAGNLNALTKLLE